MAKPDWWDKIKKPPYTVPTMEEINALPKNGYKMVSTFSGCGGSCLGFKMAGFDVLWASEFVPAARETYAANHPSTILDSRDIRQVQPEDILQAIGLQPGELDIFEGSPPCASFSTAGKGAAGWGEIKKYSDVAQRTDDLFFEYARLLRGLQPKVFVAENVAGLTRGIAKGYLFMILGVLRDCGYNVEARLLDAQWLGVPQSRQRLIFVGTRKDLPVKPAHPKPLHYRYSVREAIPWLDDTQFTPHGQNSFAVPKETIDSPAPSVIETAEGGALAENNSKVVMYHHGGGTKKGTFRDLDKPAPVVMAGGIDNNAVGNVSLVRVIEDTGGQWGAGDITDRPCPTIRAQGVGQIVVESESYMDGCAVGAEWDRLQPGEQSQKYFQLIRQDPDRVVPTITALGGNRGIASVAHPHERRKFSIAELRRVCAFPDDFKLTGSYVQQWERLGRAVPPVMMAAVARVVRDEILNRLRGGETDGQ